MQSKKYSVPPELIRNKSDELAIEQGCYFDESEPLRVKKFIETFCSNSKGEERGTRVKLLDWQYERVIKPLYGWRKANGKMRFKMCFLFIPKKNGKSFLCSSIATYHTVKEKGGNVVCVAGTKKQADIIFDESCNHVLLNPDLEGNLKILRSQLRIQNKVNGTKYDVMPFNVNTVQGGDYNIVMADELCSWPVSARTVFTNLDKSIMSRIKKNQTGLIFVATTAQFDTTTYGAELFNMCREIEDGTKLDTSILPVLYYLDQEADWADENNWRAVNPSMDITVDIDFYREEFIKAKNMPNEESAFRTLFLNQFYGSAKQFISSHIWQGCYKDFKESDFYGQEAIISIDGARKLDLCSVSITVRYHDDIFVIPRFYSPRQLAEAKQRTDNVPYLSWAAQGYITLTEGTTIDYRVVIADILELCEKFNVLEIRYDPYALQETIRSLSDEHYLNCVEVNQSSSVMSQPTAYFEQLVISNRLKHNDNPILNWCLSNVCTRFDNQDRIMIDKIRSRGRIDGVSSTIIGLSYWLSEESVDNDMPFFGVL